MTGTEGPIPFAWVDYGAFPIPDGIALPDDLKRKLEDWNVEGESYLYNEKGDTFPWSDWIIEWSDRGRSLASRVSEVLECEVAYENEASGEIERIGPPEKPVARRHHRPRRG